MNTENLKYKLDDLSVNANQYSLSGELNPDTIVLIKNYDCWEVFYLDERGNRNDEKEFKSESEACLYIYGLFKEAKDIENKFGIST